MKRVEEGASELVISRGDSAVDLQVTGIEKQPDEVQTI
jgi:hypothetical protein